MLNVPARRFCTLFIATTAIASSVKLSAADPVPTAAAIPGYPNYDAFARQVEALAKPGLAEVTSLGTTLGHRKLYLVTLSIGPAADKPAILVVGNVHGPHLVGSELALRMARQLSERLAKDEN